MRLRDLICRSSAGLFVLLNLLLGASASEPSPVELVVQGDSVYSPWLLEDDNVLRLYFGGWLNTNDWETGDKLYYIESYDHGKTWADPRLLLHVEGHSFNDPTVVKFQEEGGDRYLMYFTVRVPDSPAGPNPQVALATSDDGVNFTYEGLVITYNNGYDSNSAWSPSALRADPSGKTVYVYYHTRNSQGRVLRSTMGDYGRTLVETTPVITSEQDNKLKTNVTVIERWYGYEMLCVGYYTNSDGINNGRIERWISYDGEAWNKPVSNVVYEEDQQWIGSPYLHKTGEGDYLYFGRGNIPFPRKQDIYRVLLSDPNLPDPNLLHFDTFDVADTNNMNSGLATRVRGSGNYKYRFSNDATSDPAEDPGWAILSNRLSFTGSTNRLFLANAGDGTFANLYTLLAGKKYAFSFDVSVSGTDNIDKLGISLSDQQIGNAELFVGQMKQTGQLVVWKNGASVDTVDQWSAGSNYTIRVAVDETVATPTYEVFVNDVSKSSGTVTFANNARYAYFQSISDTDNDMAGTLDRLRIEVIFSEPAKSGFLFLITTKREGVQ
jgi:hypothetical protein